MGLFTVVFDNDFRGFAILFLVVVSFVAITLSTIFLADAKGASATTEDSGEVIAAADASLLPCSKDISSKLL